MAPVTNKSISSGFRFFFFLSPFLDIFIVVVVGVVILSGIVLELAETGETMMESETRLQIQ